MNIRCIKKIFSLWIYFLFAVSTYDFVFQTPFQVDIYDRFKFTIDTTIFSHKYFYNLTINYTSQIIIPATNLNNLKNNSQNNTQKNFSVFQKAIVIFGEILQFQVWNYQNIKNSFTIILSTNDSSSNNTLKFLRYERMLKHITAIFTQQVAKNYILPFNLFSLSNYGITVVQLQQKNLQYSISTQPFSSTYWNQLQYESVLLPWLPYFSQCSNSKRYNMSFYRYIILSDLLFPKQCQLYKIFSFPLVYCATKQIQFDCLIEELSVAFYQEPWFNNLQGVLYYLFPTPLSPQDLFFYNQSSTNVIPLLRYYYKQLVPVVYVRKGANNQYENSFTFTFKTQFNIDSSFNIISATIQGDYSEQIPRNFSKVLVRVEYLNIIDSFLTFSSPYYVYILIILFASLPFGFCFWKTQTTFFKVNMQNVKQNILVPIGKGFFLTTLTAYVYIVLMYALSAITNFSFIIATFQADLTGQALVRNNKGRNGLMLFFSGLFLVNVCVNLVYKVNSYEETKIVLEDQKRDQSNSFEDYDPHLMAQHMKSQRNYTFLFLLFSCIPFLFLYFLSLQISQLYLFFCYFFIIPLFKKILILAIKYVFLGDFLCILNISVAFQLFFTILIFMSSTVEDFLRNVIIRIIGLLFVDIAIESIVYKLKNKIKTYFKLWQKIKQEQAYQRAIFYGAIFTTKILRIFLTPLFLIIIFITLPNNAIPDDFVNLPQKRVLIISIFYIWLCPFEIYLVLLSIRGIQKWCNLKVEDALAFNQFKFRICIFRWMYDQFQQNPHIQIFYGSFQKLYFSSQLYYLVGNFALGLCMIVLGFKTILSNNYIFYNDPALMVIALTSWFIGFILYFLVSFIGLKLRLYQKRDEDGKKSKLTKVDKFMGPKDYSQYLHIEGVKNYFLKYNKQWIVSNLHIILNKDDFIEQDSRLLNLYKKYQGLAKKKIIQQKKKKQPLQYFSPSFPLPKQVITISRSIFVKVVRPLIYSWLYISKQRLYLKSIIKNVSKELMQSTCEICNMDIELQCVEKKDFQDLVNEFRVINVGNIFAEHIFLQFYRTHQKYITVCAQCKDGKQYRQKLQIKNAKGVAKQIILRWLMHAKSRILHRKIK